MLVNTCPRMSSGLLLLVVCVEIVEASRDTLRRNFATKSRYHFYDQNDIFKTPEKCEPLHLNMVLRHGTRYPSRKDMKGMDDLASNLAKYSNLTLPLTKSFQRCDKMLAKTGEEEVYNISKRLLERFPALFRHPYSSERYYFVSTSTPRTSQSASAFAFGLFEGKGHLGFSKFQPISLTTTDMSDDSLLRFYDMCPKYTQIKNELPEFHKFQNGPEMVQVKKEIADRLSLSKHFNITVADVQHMYLFCAYEVAINGSSQWCSIFEEDELDLVEYLYDVKNYWKRGYGYKINYNMSCLLLKNLTESVRNAVEAKRENSTHPLAIFHFAHAETLIPLLCIMGLFNDTEPLRASNSHKQRDRLFKTSEMSPFSGNVAVVLYSCERLETKNLKSQFFVQVLVNEKVAALPCCNSTELCPVVQFLACFGDIKGWCDFPEICNSHKTTHHSEGHNEL